LANAQKQRLKALREKRESKIVKQTLAALDDAARQPSGPLMEPILDAVRARATLGEVSDVLRSVWGVHDSG
jgi:methylmalonyl-CoA mutase N-terminal domain/subunit